MSLIKLIEFKELGDERGQLFSIESNLNIPFDIKRVYYMLGMENKLPRGFHAHKELNQVAVCIKGHCKFLMDDGKNKDIVSMNSSSTGIVISKLIWHEMYDFSDDCILMVLADDIYNENDYIRNYDDFIKQVK